MTSLYDILEVSPNASQETIAAAYRSLIARYHPDKTASLGSEFRELAEKKAKELNHAYSILKDADKRQRYDADLAQTEAKSRRESAQSSSEQNQHGPSDNSGPKNAGDSTEPTSDAESLEEICRCGIIYAKFVRNGGLMGAFMWGAGILFVASLFSKYFDHGVGSIIVLALLVAAIVGVVFSHIFLFIYGWRSLITIQNLQTKWPVNRLGHAIVRYGFFLISVLLVPVAIMGAVILVGSFQKLFSLHLSASAWSNTHGALWADTLGVFTSFMLCVCIIASSFIPVRARIWGLASEFLTKPMRDSLSQKERDAIRIEETKDPAQVSKFKKIIGLENLWTYIYSLEKKPGL